MRRMFSTDAQHQRRHTQERTTMAGRPKRPEDVISLALRITPALLRKVDRCKALLELREGTSLSRTSVLVRALELGAEQLIATWDAAPEVPAPAPSPEPSAQRRRPRTTTPVG